MGVSRVTMEVPKNENSNLQKFESFWARQVKYLEIVKLELKHDIILECQVRALQMSPKNKNFNHSNQTH